MNKKEGLHDFQPPSEMAGNSKNHQRRSIRLKGYDYSQPGLYFITICVQNNVCLFGKIENDELTLNEAGKMVEKWHGELTNKFNDIRCHEMIVMPNHFHCILEIVWPESADRGVCHNDINGSHSEGKMGEHTGSSLRDTNESILPEYAGEHTGSPLRNTNESTLPEYAGEHTGSPLRGTNESTVPEHVGEHTGSPLRDTNESTLPEYAGEHTGSPLRDTNESNFGEHVGEHIGSPLRNTNESTLPEYAGEHTGSPLRGTNESTFGEHVGEHIGSPLRDTNESIFGEHAGEHIGSPLRDTNESTFGEHVGEHIGSPLRRVVQWLKTMTTNEYIRGVKNDGWQPFSGKLWQRNYYEHIIRNEKSYKTIADYIINNPYSWQRGEVKDSKNAAGNSIH
jgi:REP element-mobilizing transposase RayT